MSGGGATWRLTLWFSLVAQGSGGSWWWNNHTNVAEPSVHPWRQWVAGKSPWFRVWRNLRCLETAHTDDWINFSRRFDGSDWSAWMTDSWRTSPTEELADLVRSQTATSTNPAGTMKGLSKQTEELVFLMKAV